MTPPERSLGARMERKAMRAYLRRIRKDEIPEYQKLLNKVLDWVLTRQKRYDKKQGGLGRSKNGSKPRDPLTPHQHRMLAASSTE